MAQEPAYVPPVAQGQCHRVFLCDFWTWLGDWLASAPVVEWLSWLTGAREPWPDDVPVRAFGPRMVCTRCGIIGADARPNWRERPPRESLPGAEPATGPQRRSSTALAGIVHRRECPAATQSRSSASAFATFVREHPDALFVASDAFLCNLPTWRRASGFRRLMRNVRLSQSAG
jgi:hypothetical protein